MPAELRCHLNPPLTTLVRRGPLHGVRSQHQVCIDVLTGYLTTPNPTYLGASEDKRPSAGEDGTVRATIVRLLAAHRSASDEAQRAGTNYAVRGADLRAVDLNHADLRQADLRGGSAPISTTAYRPRSGQIRADLRRLSPDHFFRSKQLRPSLGLRHDLDTTPFP
jgi:hypothetical protein